MEIPYIRNQKNINRKPKTMILIATENLYRNIGSKYEKLSFTKGNGYKYLPFDSNDNMHQLIGENGMVIFNNEEFYKYFKTPEEWNKLREQKKL